MSQIPPQRSVPQGRSEIRLGGNMVLLEKRLEIYEENRDENTTCTILEKSHTLTS
jgi:hypothetical protein